MLKKSSAAKKRGNLHLSKQKSTANGVPIRDTSRVRREAVVEA